MTTTVNDPDYLNQFSGTYTAIFPEGQPEQELTISVCGNLLAAIFSEGDAGVLYPKSPGVFEVEEFAAVNVFFSFNEAGRLVKVEACNILNETLLWEAIPAIGLISSKSGPAASRHLARFYSSEIASAIPLVVKSAICLLSLGRDLDEIKPIAAIPISLAFQNLELEK